MSEWVSLYVFIAQTQHFLNYKKEVPLSGVPGVWKSSGDGILLLILYEVEITICFFLFSAYQSMHLNSIRNLLGPLL